MSVFLMIFKISLLTFGGLLAVAYCLFQLYQAHPRGRLSFKMIDYIAYFLVACLFGFGTNSYTGLLAFVPLLLIHAWCWFVLSPEKLKNSGRWVEVQWRKLLPKGFGGYLPKEFLDNMSKIPDNKHFVVPRLYLILFVRFLNYRMNKDMVKEGAAAKTKLPKNMGPEQQAQSLAYFADLNHRLLALPPQDTLRQDFPFGVLKVSRL